MKKIITFLVLTAVIVCVFAGSAFAATETVSGFYDLGTASGITITPMAAKGAVERISADIDGDGSYEVLYKNSDKLKVTCTGAVKDAYYGVLLVEGTDLPTKENSILYIDQLTAGSETIEFEVYPILPEKTTASTLYVSCSDPSEDIVSINLSYTPASVVEISGNTPGDADGNGKVESEDVVLVRRHIVGGYEVNVDEAVVDVNDDNKVDLADVILMRRHIVGGYGVELK